MHSYRVTVGKEGLGFAAAHFIAYDGEGCEPVHGHDYRVSVTLEGDVNEAGYVCDFVALEAAVRELIGPLDHRLLLPGRGKRIRVTEEGDRVRVRCENREYVFPVQDVRILPVDNTTAERLAAHLWAELAERLGATGPPSAPAPADGPPLRLEVEVEESPGRSARYGSALPG